MKTFSRVAGMIAAAATIIVVAAGCTAGGGGADGQQDSPLMEYFGAIYGTNLSPDEQQQRFTEQQTKSEEIVAQCMKEQGFEYQPNVQSASISFGDDGLWKPDDREWVSQYGYGMVASPMSEQPTDQEVYEDPNQDYINSLSASEQTAYWEALYGPQPTEEELSDDGSYEYDWTTAGCQGQAQHETQNDPMQDEQFASLNEALTTFYSDMSTAPGLTAVHQKWSSCMADAGYSGFSTQPDAQSSISEKLSKYYENLSPDAASNSDDPELKQLGEEEIALALADLDCREKTNFTAESQKVQFELEREFIAAHKAELEALKAASEQAGQ